MDKQTVDMFLTTNAKYFESSAIPVIRQKLEKCDEEAFMSVQALEFKDPTTIFLISIFVGGLGIDRFMIGDTGMGVLKLLTAGCCGVLTIVDWFTIQRKTRQKNLAIISMVI